MNRVRVAAIQMNSGADVQRNLELAGKLIAEAADDGCRIARAAGELRADAGARARQERACRGLERRSDPGLPQRHGDRTRCLDRRRQPADGVAGSGPRLRRLSGHTTIREPGRPCIAKFISSTSTSPTRQSPTVSQTRCIRQISRCALIPRPAVSDSRFATTCDFPSCSVACLMTARPGSPYRPHSHRRPARHTGILCCAGAPLKTSPTSSLRASPAITRTIERRSVIR